MAEDLHPDTLALIDEFGWCKLNKFDIPNDANSRLIYTQTVNLAGHSALPELMVFGLRKQVVDNMIAKLVRATEKGLTWKQKPLQVKGILTDYMIELRPVHASWLPHALPQTNAYRKHSGQSPLTDVAQVFWPDRDGKFPWDDTSKDDFADQPRMDLPMPANLKH